MDTPSSKPRMLERPVFTDIPEKGGDKQTETDLTTPTHLHYTINTTQRYLHPEVTTSTDNHIQQTYSSHK